MKREIMDVEMKTTTPKKSGIPKKSHMSQKRKHILAKTARGGKIEDQSEGNHLHTFGEMSKKVDEER